MLSRILLTISAVAVLAGCSSVPTQIQTAPSNDIQLNQASQDSSVVQGQYVRWGGQVVGIENTDQATYIQIVQFPLNNFGRPITNRDSQGRFVARTSDFVDPAIYTTGTLLTFTGTINGTIERTVDKRNL